jgi:hypothetical protein
MWHQLLGMFRGLLLGANQGWQLTNLCWTHLLLFCSDDVDDQYTEKGRQLLRKEGEALAAGMRIGEILAAGDLDLPGVMPRKRQGT